MTDRRVRRALFSHVSPPFSQPQGRPSLRPKTYRSKAVENGRRRSNALEKVRKGTRPSAFQTAIQLSKSALIPLQRETNQKSFASAKRPTNLYRRRCEKAAKKWGFFEISLTTGPAVSWAGNERCCRAGSRQSACKGGIAIPPPRLVQRGLAGLLSRPTLIFIHRLRNIVIALCFWGSFLGLALWTKSKVLGILFAVSFGIAAIGGKIMSSRRRRW